MSSKRKRSERDDDLTMKGYRERERLKDFERRALLSRLNNVKPTEPSPDSGPSRPQGT